MFNVTQGQKSRNLLKSCMFCQQKEIIWQKTN